VIQQEKDTLKEFLTGDTARRLELIKDPSAAHELRPLLGDDAFGELQSLSKRAGTDHLAGPSANLVFLPGVMGSVLASQGRGGIWWLDPRSRDHIDDLRLGPDGLIDANPEFDVGPVVVDCSYDGFYVAVSEHRDFGYRGFHYDWRKPLAASAEGLRDTVLRASSANGGHPVHLVAHSMGGLLARSALKRFPELWKHVGKVVFLATPHYGSPAIAGYLKNHLWGFDLYAVLGLYLSRETFRSLWGVLELLPAPQGVYPGSRPGEVAPTTDAEYVHPCANFDLYDAEAWRLDLPADQKERLQTALSAAMTAHRDLYEWHMALDQNLRDRMAVIAGVGYRTLFRLAYRRRFGFLWEHMDRVTERVPGDRHRDGDGRVPLASAELEHVGETRYVRAVHGTLPTVRAVSDDALRFLADKPMQLPRTAKAALQGHLADGQLSSETPALAGVCRAETAALDDPGYLNFTPLPEAAVADVKAAVIEGRRPAFELLHIL